jgi:addiction module HigA family antidote
MVHPGKVLLDEVMKPLGVSRNKLARDIDVPVGRISAIVSGSRTITADTALRLAKYFGTSPELWLKLQADYELAVVRATSWKNIDPRVRVFQIRQGDIPADAGEAPPDAPAARPPLSPEPEPLELTERVDPIQFEASGGLAHDALPDEPQPLELTDSVEPVTPSSFPRSDKAFEPEFWNGDDDSDYETDALDIPKRAEHP